MPALIQNTKKQEASSRIKKFVSIINQALISAEMDYGPREYWESGTIGTSDSAFDFLNIYIKPYVKSFDIEKRKLLEMDMATLRFVDGSQMSVKIGSCYNIYYDINGEKAPNELGRDIYAFSLCRTSGRCNVNSNQLRPYYCASTGTPYPSHQAIINSCKSSGTYCTILLQENQYEFPRDYPKRL